MLQSIATLSLAFEYLCKVEMLEVLLSDIEKLGFTGTKSCLRELTNLLNDIIYILEAKGSEADKALLQIQACCWMLYEERHVGTNEKLFLTFHYIKDKANRACQKLLHTKQRTRSAA